MNITETLDKLTRSRWQRMLLMLGCGAATTLSFAPFHLSLMPVLSFGILFLLLTGSDSKTAFRHGYVFGLGLFGSGVYWVNVSMSVFGGVSLPVSVFLTCLFVLFLALFPAMSAWCYVRFFNDRNGDKTWIAVMPAVFVLFEWVRGWIFTGFPWLSIGYSQTDTPLSSFATVSGVFGLSYVTLVCVALVASLVKHGRTVTRVALPVLALLVISGMLLGTVQWTTASGKALTATLVQGNISQDKKWLPSQRQPTIDLYTRLTRENWQSQLIVWPETALPAFYHQASGFLRRLQSEAQSNQADLLLGLPVMDENNRRYFNAVISLGKEQTFYHKQHLVPFGEFIPFRGILGNILKVFDVPLPDFSYSENKNRLLQIEGHQVGISICYEDAFGEEAILALPEADLLVNVSNDAWFGDSIAPPQHLQIARMRAIETGRPLLRATNTGITAFIDHHGKVSSSLPQFQAAALTATVQPMTGSTPYILWGNWFIVSLLCLLLAWAYWRNRTKHNQ